MKLKFSVSITVYFLSQNRLKELRKQLRDIQHEESKRKQLVQKEKWQRLLVENNDGGAFFLANTSDYESEESDPESSGVSFQI